MNHNVSMRSTFSSYWYQVNLIYYRWTRLRLTMEPFPAVFEPFTESPIIGLMSCWAVWHLWEISFILFFVEHLAVSFLLDYILLRYIQGVSFYLLSKTCFYSLINIGLWIFHRQPLHSDIYLCRHFHLSMFTWRKPVLNKVQV